MSALQDLEEHHISFAKGAEQLGVAFNLPVHGVKAEVEEDATRVGASDAPDGIEGGDDKRGASDENLQSNAELSGEEVAYFPHIATKNCKFEVNFGNLVCVVF